MYYLVPSTNMKIFAIIKRFGKITLFGIMIVGALWAIHSSQEKISKFAGQALEPNGNGRGFTTPEMGFFVMMITQWKEIPVSIVQHA